jgi:hypothetical protein
MVFRIHGQHTNRPAVTRKVRETRKIETLTICLLMTSIVVCYQDVYYTTKFRTHRFRSLVRTQ